jgi:DNA-binding beta-propeller fold protein YncE
MMRTQVFLIVLVMAVSAQASYSQASAQATNSAPNPYEAVKDWARMPEGRAWGSTSAVDIDRDGRSIWVAERCGQNTCLDRATGQMSSLPSILKFDASGKIVASFGQGMLIFPHGITVDRDGNVWVTDGQDNAPQAARGRGQAPQGPPAANAAATKGHQVLKFSPEGKLLMTLGKPGGANAPEYFFQPNDVLVAPNGEIFISEGHSSTAGAMARILKFSKDGKLIKTWGKLGAGPGEFDQPHALAMDSRGRLFVGDRNNNRVQIFDQEGKFIDQWPQFSRPSGIFIDRNDNLYVADSESESVARNHDGWKRGIRIGSAKDGKVVAFIPDPETRGRPDFTGTSAAEGVAVDAQGNVYGAEVGPRGLKKYVKR